MEGGHKFVMTVLDGFMNDLRLDRKGILPKTMTVNS